MLLVLQYAALLCAFFLPFSIGWMVQSIRAHDRRRLVIAAVLLAVSLCVIGLTVWLAFGISSVS